MIQPFRQQSRYLSRRIGYRPGIFPVIPIRFSETNQFLGPHPSLDEVDRYFATCLIGNAVIAYILPRDLRRWWQALSLNMEMEFVNHNYNLGVNMKF